MLRVELLASTHNLTSARTVEVSFKPEDTLVAVKDKIRAAMALRQGTTPDLRLQIRNPLTTLGYKDSDSVVCLLFDKFENGEQHRTGSHPRDSSGGASATEDAEVFVDARPGGAIELLVAEPGRVTEYLAEDATCAKLRLMPSTQLMVSNHSWNPAEGGLTVIIVEPSGTEIIFVLKHTTPLQKMMHAYCNRKGVSTSSVRFLFEDSNRLNETQTPQQLDMEDGDIIDVMQEQQGGCIASPVPALFGAHAHAVGLRYLECAGELTHATPQDARAIVRQLGGSLDAEPKVVVEPVLDASACAALTTYLDERAAAHETGAAPDLRLTLGEAELEALIGQQACAAVVAAFGAPFDAIRLRRAEASAPLPQCVAFHTDFSKRTMQVKLDDIHLHLRGGYVHEYLYPWVNRSRSTATTSTKAAAWSSPPVQASCSHRAPAAQPPVRPRPLEHSAGIQQRGAHTTV